MNKYNIEVGDEIIIINSWPVTKVDNKGVWLSNRNSNPDSFYKWSTINEELDRDIITNGEQGWKLIKMDKGKIIGYTLLKDTPDNKKGTEFIKDSQSGDYVKKGDEDYEYYAKDVEGNTEWFSPIYEVVKPTEVFVDTLAGKVKVTSEKLKLEGDRNSLVYTEDFSKVARAVTKVLAKTSMFEVKVETFKVGCQTFHVNDIPKLEEAIKQVS